jgi:hypothetical protein
VDAVFVSHAGRDLAWAEWVAWQLREAGHEVELDRWDWAAGDNFVLRMSSALSRASLVVAVVSKAYFEADRFTTEEWSAALAARSRLVLLRVEEAMVAEALRPYIFRDLFGVDEHTAREIVLQAASGPTGPPTRPPAFPGPLPAAGPRLPGTPPELPAAAGPRLPGTLPSVWNVPNQNAVFTGRDGMLARLRDGFTTGTRLQALHGIGGVGKSTLAIEYAHRFASSYDYVWWIDAERPDHIAEHLATLAVTAGWSPADSDTPACASRAGQRLRTLSRWLLLFDNAEDPAALNRWLPPGPHGHVIVTSRNPNWRQLGTPTAVDVFARAESIALLRSLVPLIPEPDAHGIASALADLPLAVAQAAGVLTETGLSPARYLLELAEHTDELMAEGTPVDYPVPLAAAVAISVDRLAAEDRDAVQLLRQCASMAPEPIPIDIFDSGVALYRRIARIGRYGLARVSGGTIQLHRLTQCILAATDPDHPGSRREAATLLAAAVPDDMGDEPATWPRWAQLLPHLLIHLQAGDDSELRSALDRAAWYLLARGELQAGLALAQKLYDRWRQDLGPEHPRTVGVAVTLARAYRAVGRYPDAKWLDMQVFAHRRRLGGEDDPDTLIAASNLAVELSFLGENDAARELDEDTLARRRRVLGDDHPDTLISAGNLAFDFRRLGADQAARDLDEDTFARQRRVLGPDHPATLSSADNLANDLARLGDHGPARELHEDTLARRERVLGRDHPDTLASAGNLAIDLANLGEYSEARALNEDVLARMRQVLGEDHPDTLTSAENLAFIHGQVG